MAFAGAPIYNSTVFCDAMATSCYILEAAVATQAAALATCTSLGGALVAFGSGFNEQVGYGSQNDGVSLFSADIQCLSVCSCTLLAAAALLTAVFVTDKHGSRLALVQLMVETYFRAQASLPANYWVGYSRSGSSAAWTAADGSTLAQPSLPPNKAAGSYSHWDASTSTSLKAALLCALANNLTAWDYYAGDSSISSLQASAK
jgi:hypothetical protein